MASDDNFEGHYRLGPKTSPARSASGKLLPTKRVASIEALLASVPDYAAMKQKHPKLIVSATASAAKKKAATNQRLPEERRNVAVTCWLFDAKREDDNDYHVIVGSRPQANKAAFLNVEVSGLPTGGNNLKLLQSARKLFETLVGKKLTKSKYTPFSPPLKVRVSGSLFFDGDHLPGKIGPGTHKPKTVWEIHPVLSIKRV